MLKILLFLYHIKHHQVLVTVSSSVVILGKVTNVPSMTSGSLGISGKSLSTNSTYAILG